MTIELDYTYIKHLISLKNGQFTITSRLKDYYLYILMNGDPTIIDTIIITKYKNEISREEINTLIDFGPDACDYYDKQWYKKHPNCTCKDAYNWMVGPLYKIINEINKDLNLPTCSQMNFKSCHILPIQLCELISLVNDNKITRESGIKLLETTNYESFIKQAKDQNLLISKDVNDLTNIIKTILNNSNKEIQDYKNGNEKIFKFLTGKIMKEIKGKFEGKLVQTKLKEMLDKI